MLTTLGNRRDSAVPQRLPGMSCSTRATRLGPALAFLYGLLSATVAAPPHSQPDQPQSPCSCAPTQSWRLPPTQSVPTRSQRLVNYHHLALPESRVSAKAKRLAQWDVIILNHDDVLSQRLSFKTMRQLNPRLRILLWLPLQGPNRGLAQGVPPRGPHDWYARTAAGAYLEPHWGGYLMNVCADDFAWPRHLFAYAQACGVGERGYDGVMIDCLWPAEPQGCDVNLDGVHDAQDTRAWREGALRLLTDLRRQFPRAIITGNGGIPWDDDCPYYAHVNGCMHENALGDQFGGTEWTSLWNGLQRGLTRAGLRPACHFVMVDLRCSGRSQADAAKLRCLTDDDRRRFRLGLATSLLLDGGYFGFDRGDCLHGQLWWFDDYDVDLGDPVRPCGEGEVAPGTWSRWFTRGLVVVNPSPRPVTAETPEPMLDTTTRKVGTTLAVPAQDARLFTRTR